MRFGAVRALSLEESRWVRDNIEPERILRSRFAYKDKHHARRKTEEGLGPKPRARWCVAGQSDPDFGAYDMVTDAATAGRQSVLLALLLSLARRWSHSTVHIKAAFLNGIPAPRQLFFHQPKRGIPTLEKGQLVEIVKGVFGLSTSPKLWWMKLSGELLKLNFLVRDERIRVR